MAASPDLLTAAGVIAALVTVVTVLWRDHQRADQEDRDQRDLAQDLLRASLQNNADAIAAWNRRIEQDAARSRRADKP